MRTYTAGVIGLGRIGYEWVDSHYNTYHSHPRISKVITCDTIKPADYKDYMEMVCNNELDIVSVCTPPETHCKIVCNIAPFVRAIYCEKPIATTLEDADKMIMECHSCDTVLQVNHQRRFLRPKFRFSRGILNSGTHAFDAINFYFKDPSLVDFEYIDCDDYIFEFKFTGTPSVPKEAINHLIDCIENHHESISSGETARESLRQCLEMLKK